MKGFLQKPGKRMKLRVTRFFQLEGTELSSYRTEGAGATWTINIAEAILTGNEQTWEINVEIPDVKTITLFASSFDSFAKWMRALENAVARKFEMYYESGAFVGQGSFSVVKVVSNILTGEQFAAKFIDKRRSGDRFGDEELKSLRGISHPNVVRTFDVFESNEQFIIVSEHVSRGLLYDVLSVQLPSEKVLSHCVKQVLEATSHLHDNGMIHRNLKPENVLANGEYHPYTVKLTDCGIRNWYREEEEGTDPVIRPIGDECYIAPEVLAQKNYSAKMDSWAIGMLTYHLLVGRSPSRAGAHAPIDFADPVLRNVSEVAISFLRGLLEVDDKKRLKASEALHHPWIVDSDRLSSRPVGNKLTALSTSQRKVAKKINLRDERKEPSAYQTTGSFQRNTPDILVYGSRSVTDPGAYSVNRDPWGGKAPPQSKGLLRSSRSISRRQQKNAESSSSRSNSFMEREAGRSSRGLFRTISGMRMRI
mmetsp:Transcript_6679/g.20238  ORF Transcript_6679/g.20238 Transcript_6679/m.20238 type:complete len:479 (-) Transcript_6679:2749-4185(-)